MACKGFERDYPRYRCIAVDMDTLSIARSMSANHPIRSLDAIHLASAVRLRQAAGVPVMFVGADHRLLESATAEGFQVLNVEKAKAIQTID